MHARTCVEKTGVQAEWLRAGGSRTGEVLSDSSTLEACGLGYDMNPWEYLWIDSEANQRSFAEEVERARPPYSLFARFSLVGFVHSTGDRWRSKRTGSPRRQ